MVLVSASHVGDARGSGIVSSTADVLWMRRIGGVCEMCMCLARCGVGVDFSLHEVELSGNNRC